MNGTKLGQPTWIVPRAAVKNSVVSARQQDKSQLVSSSSAVPNHHVGTAAHHETIA